MDEKKETDETGAHVILHQNAADVTMHLFPKNAPHEGFGDFFNLKVIDYHEHIRDPNKFSRENTLVWALLLKVNTFSPGMVKFNLFRAKKRRLPADEKKYQYRMYTFASLTSGSNTFVIIDCETKGHDCLMKSRIGDQFAIIEPNLFIRYIGGDVPIIEDCQVIPARLEQSHLLPEVFIDDDIASKSTKYFVLHGATVSFEGVHLRETCCNNGDLCDFRDPHNTDCACWYQYIRGSFGDGLGASTQLEKYVLAGDVRITHSARGNSRVFEKVENWSSQHFTELVFDQDIPQDPLNLEYDMQITTFMRDRLRSLVKYVNENAPDGLRGWTVIGWYKDSLLHIVRIQPTFLQRDDLRQAGLLLPHWFLGQEANISRVIRANQYMAMRRKV